MCFIEGVLLTMPIKETLESAISQARFLGPALYRVLLPELLDDNRTCSLVADTRNLLGQQLADHVILCVVRSAFLIEPVKHPAIETTKMEVRWVDERAVPVEAQKLPLNDPRHASFETCLDIFLNVMDGLRLTATQVSAERLMLERFKRYGKVSYEIPLDYRERRLESAMHTPDNVVWIWHDPNVATTIALREAIEEPGVVGDEARTFNSALDKVNVKTYLTDRVLTGVHKTNREKRWEAHPKSVHFATRAACLGIERQLMEQICYFDAFPNPVQKALLQREVINHQDMSLCPVTLEPLSYPKLKQELAEAEHGKSSFQVGHLNPLKAVSSDPNVGHTARNISWISANGNRIQGHLSLLETRRMLHRIAQRYESRGWPEDSESKESEMA